MKKLSILGNSFAYIPMKDKSNAASTERGFVQLLEDDYGMFGGYYSNGFTVLAAVDNLSKFLPCRKSSHFVIINLGVVESLTQAPENFLQTAMQNLAYWGCTPYMQTLVFPKMLEAIKDLTHKRELKYYSLLTLPEFSMIMDVIAKYLEGYSVIMLGMSCPNTCNANWVAQAGAVDRALHNLAARCNYFFIDVWNLCKEYVVDSNHITEEGHSILYKRIKEVYQ